jgi:hypothetical protein
MHEFGRDYQPPFDNVKRRLRGMTLVFTRGAGTNTPLKLASKATFGRAPNLQETVVGFTFRTCTNAYDRRQEAPSDERFALRRRIPVLVSRIASWRQEHDGRTTP